VAIRTPVPKCLEKKRKCRGMGNPGNRRARIGNEHAMSGDVSHEVSGISCKCVSMGFT
jgi:hypothetical protein